MTVFLVWALSANDIWVKGVYARRDDAKRTIAHLHPCPAEEPDYWVDRANVYHFIREEEVR